MSQDSIQVVPKSNATGQWLRVCADGLGLLASILPPRKPISETTVAAYAYALQDLSLDQLRLCLGLAAKQCKFMPSPAELRDLAGVECSDELAALKAWQLVHDAVIRHGGYKSIYFTDPVIGVVIETLGGWVSLCVTPSDEFDRHVRREFIKSYIALAKRHKDVMPKRLAGLHELTNMTQGHARDTVVVVGKPLQQALTMESPAIEEPSR